MMPRTFYIVSMPVYIAVVNHGLIAIIIYICSRVVPIADRK